MPRARRWSGRVRWPRGCRPRVRGSSRMVRRSWGCGCGRPGRSIVPARPRLGRWAVAVRRPRRRTQGTCVRSANTGVPPSGTAPGPPARERDTTGNRPPARPRRPFGIQRLTDEPPPTKTTQEPDLNCSLHGGIIPVPVPPEVPLREFPYNAVVELVNPGADTVSRKTYTGADADWYVKAEDIVLKNAGNPRNHTPQGQPKK